MEREVRKEYNPKMSELESCLAKSIEKDAIKKYKSQIKNLSKEIRIKLSTKLKYIVKDKTIEIRKNQ